MADFPDPLDLMQTQCGHFSAIGLIRDALRPELGNIDKTVLPQVCFLFRL
jgi:hypothetical protein